MEQDIDLHLGKRLRSQRRRRGMTQRQLAQEVGVRGQQVQKYECGANRISASQLWRFAEALGVSAGYFYDGLLPVSAARQDKASEPLAAA